MIEEVKQDLEEVANLKDSRLEQLLFLFCKQTKLRYNKLIEEENSGLFGLHKKSELMKNTVPKREEVNRNGGTISMKTPQDFREPAPIVDGKEAIALDNLTKRYSKLIE